jgi:hypothetical protein
LLVKVVEIFSVAFDEWVALDNRPRAGLLALSIECGPGSSALANQVTAGAGPCC